MAGETTTDHENPAACTPPGLQSLLEGDLVVTGGCRVAGFGLICPAQKIDRLGDDLATVAVDAFTIGPLRVVDAAANQNFHPFLAMLLNRLAETVEAGDAMPFGILDAETLFIAKNLAVRIAGTRGRQGEVRDTGVALCGAGFRGLTDIAGENDDILHFKSPLLHAEGPSLRRAPEKTVGRRLH